MCEEKIQSNLSLTNHPFGARKVHRLPTAWCSEIGFLWSLDAPELQAFSGIREPISLHQSQAVADPGGGGGGGDAPPPVLAKKKKKEKNEFSGQELLFPNVLRVLKLLLVIPVTTASVERANSALGFVKSDHRSTMSEGRLNALLRLYVHKDTQLDFEEVVTAYGHKHPRRMLLG